MGWRVGRLYCRVHANIRNTEEAVSFFFFFLSRPSSALISWSSTQVLVDHWGTFCAGGYPNVHFSFFLPGGCGGV